MGKIIVLDELTANKIAAGEVIERPASVVKEMVENSIDAGATNIQVEIKSGGIKYIRITDNGIGFDADDAMLAFDKHATSKIKVADDLDNITTLGFRGEALASIAAVSDVKLISKTQQADKGIYVNIKGGTFLEKGEIGCANGTTFEISDLFFNTPARYKFLKKDHTEAGYVASILENIALCNPSVSFKLVSNGETILQTPGNGDLRSCIYSIFGRNIATAIKEVKFEESHMSVTGFVGDITVLYSNRNRQIFFVNGRHIKSKLITAALDQAFKTLTMKGKFPFAVLSISLNPNHVDVNVHPAKTEVRFDDESRIFDIAYRAVSNSLFGKEEKPAISVTMPSESVKVPEKKPVDFKIFEQYLLVKEEKPVIKHEDTNTSTKQIDILESYREKDVKEVLEIKEEMEVKEIKEELNEEIQDNEIEETQEIKIIQNNQITYINEENKIENIAPYKILTSSKTIVDENESIKSKAEIVEEEQKENKIFEDARIIGQIWNAYILMEYDNKLLLMDQHAAHERLMYEEIRCILSGTDPMVQMLLSPVTVEVTPSEWQTLRNNFSYFNKLGIEMEEFGSSMVIIRSIPTMLIGRDISSFVQEGINKILKGGTTSLYSDEAIFQMACKAAVKANMKLDLREIQELIKKLSSLKNPFTCPHGRPIITELTKYEVEKRFKRV